MKVWITKDYIDGRRSQARKVQLESVPTSGMLLMLMEQGVVGLTITTAEPLRELEFIHGSDDGA